MFKNYFRTAWRNLLGNKGFSAINISGLAIGMTSAVLILLWIQNEWSHDRFHVKGDRIYTLNNRDKFNGELWAWSSTPKILGPTVKQDFPEVEDAVRVNGCGFLFTVGDKRLNARGNFVDTGFLNVFSFPLLKGTASTALGGIYNIVLTEKLAKKLFGNSEAMGKVIRIDSSANFTVTGVLEDLPNNTIFDFEYLMPWDYMSKIGYNDSLWGNNSVSTFVLLKPGVSQTALDAKIKDITINHTEGKNKETTQVFRQRFSDTWLYGKSENGKYVGGRIETVKLFGIIAALILLIACINFMNLSTARSEKRAKEVGIRKVVGAPKSMLIVFGPASDFNVIHFKLNPAKPVAEALRLAGQVFKQYNPQYPFDYKFVDEAYAKKFDDQRRTGKLAALFAGLTIFISCLGLFGLAAYMAQNRIKEIGVRKVLGASVASITTLLSKDFLKLVVISLLIASPLAWWAMHKWLRF